MTHEERLADQRDRRKRTSNWDVKKYEKTPKGYLMRSYRNMLSRVTGVQWRKAHLYKGLPILDKQEFYEWALESKEFWDLFAEYQLSGYDRKLAPSVNRIDSSQGYLLDNMEWITHSENSRDGAMNRHYPNAGIVLPFNALV